MALNKAASDSGFLVLFFICNLQMLEQVISKVNFYLVCDSIMVSGSSVKKKKLLVKKIKRGFKGENSSGSS